MAGPLPDNPTEPRQSTRASVDPDAVLGSVLRRARLAAGLTCEAAAERAHLSPTRIAGIEDGDGLLVFADALPLAQAYGRSLRDLSAAFERQLGSEEKNRE